MPPDWFTLGDRDIATHIVRTQMLRAGWSLTDVTAALCARWQPGVHLLPMSDDPVETHVVVLDDDGAREALHFQEWWVREQAKRTAQEFVFLGAAEAKPTSAVLDAMRDADVVLLPPSNPVVSIGAILQIAGIGDALRATAAPVVGVSPIIGGAPVRGMADACLSAIGVETSAAAVAGHYGARIAGGLLDGWLVAEEDASTPAPAGVVQRSRPLLMTDRSRTLRRSPVQHSTSPSSCVVEPHGAASTSSHSRGCRRSPAGHDLAASHRLRPSSTRSHSRAAGRRHRGGVEQGGEQSRRARRHRRDARGGGRRLRPCAWSPNATASRSSRRGMGLVLAAAGVDASNVAAGSLVLLPEDPDASARALRASLQVATRLHGRRDRD